MPAYRRRNRVEFLEDVNNDSFGRALGSFPVGPKNEQKWARKGDTGVVSSWSKGGWLKVRLDRHGAIVTVRSNRNIVAPFGFAVLQAQLQEKKRDVKEIKELRKKVVEAGRACAAYCGMIDDVIKPEQAVDNKMIESAHKRLMNAAQALIDLSQDVQTNTPDECPGCETGCDNDDPHRLSNGEYHPNCATRTAATRSFGAMQSRANTPSPVIVGNDDEMSLECLGLRPQMDKMFG